MRSKKSGAWNATSSNFGRGSRKATWTRASPNSAAANVLPSTRSSVSYKVEIGKSVRQKLVDWQLPDAVLVEAYLQLRDKLSQDPWRHLRRTSAPFDGMEFRFSMIDPENRL